MHAKRQAETGDKGRSLCEVFQHLGHDEFIKWAEQQVAYKPRRGIFSTALIVWLMIFQRLNPSHTLSRAVAELKAGKVDELLGDGRRAREGRISGNTGGYSKARSKLPVELVRLIAEQIFSSLAPPDQVELLWHGHRVFGVEGSVIDLAPESEALHQAFPPGGNQKGRCRTPVVQIVVGHDLVTGAATPPQWGPKYGKEATSEQELLQQLIPSLPAGSVIVGDRNFGVFSVTPWLHQAGHPVVFRLTIDRVTRVLGKAPRHGMDEKVVWTASDHDCRAHPELTKESQVEGRIIVVHLHKRGERKPTTLYLFTTLALPAAALVELYGRRWCLEDDLRSLKRTVHMYKLTAKTKDNVEKDLLLGVAAYNLVRTTITVAAQRLALAPRAISFSRALEAIDANADLLFYSAEPRKLERFLDDFKYLQLRRAKHKPTAPRMVLPTKRKYPLLRIPRETARLKPYAKK
jgi:hypothetical protein